MTEKPKVKLPSLKQVASGIGIASLVSLISFLSTIFLTRTAHSEWLSKSFYPVNHRQDISISKNEQEILHIGKTLIRLEKNQESIIKLLVGRK